MAKEQRKHKNTSSRDGGRPRNRPGSAEPETHLSVIDRFIPALKEKITNYENSKRRFQDATDTAVHLQKLTMQEGDDSPTKEDEIDKTMNAASNEYAKMKANAMRIIEITNALKKELRRKRLPQ